MLEDKSKAIQFATMIILHSGNARKLISDAYAELIEFDFDAARKKIELAREETMFAHKEQSKIISSETNEQSIEFSLLLTHAQDTLMSAVSEIQIAKNLIELIEKVRQDYSSKV